MKVACGKGVGSHACSQGQAGQRFVPGSASSSGRQQPWPTKPVQYFRQHRRHAGCQASRLPSVQVVSASEGEGAVQSLAEDKWIARTLAAFSSSAREVPRALEEMRAECSAALRTQRMPTTRNEEYRFTDITPLLQLDPQVAETADLEAAAPFVEAHALKGAAARLVIVDGILAPQLCHTQGLPEGVYIGSAAHAPDDFALQHLGRQARVRGTPFALINGATARDVACVAVHAGVQLEGPIHVLYINTGRGSMCAPRLLCVLGAKAGAEVVEEFVGPAEEGASGSRSSFTNAVTELRLSEDAQLKHGYAALEGRGALAMKGTLVAQGARSQYRLTEARVGGALTRHDLSIQQTGEETETEMGSFLLCGEGQLHDLHSKLVLEHPRGTANQLHKCIVASGSGRGVFDGSVRVERAAQKTDAGQLSRNLLLVPRAAVNVKPNLQIVADDVKCTHGCAVSDLEEAQLFYFRARGVDAATARRVLVYSFGAEVTMGFSDQSLRERIQAAVDATLARVPVLDAQPA